jgi:putative holliday junction resolvase
VRSLGVDLGEKRIGLALSDPMGIVASPLEVHESQDRRSALAYIASLVRRHELGEIVIGLPLDMRGDSGPQAEAARAFADELRVIVSIPVVLWDERLTTMQAERALLEGDVSRAGRRQRIDKIAASLMLQSFLDSRPLEGSRER